ncbi:hypothetical protein CYMTET_31198 [Cymbomonas tetramitiformis]|uniref:Uncharacterized protein n=1 Tax=Cymbomonas tetramitiformis TaxID=36881 RepID=A0AAE0KT74_9CHLO|nr:hypothetical protein CYMTET_31198 [Cymbomonas tetramitiformis]|eukprot:gene16967-20160_t
MGVAHSSPKFCPQCDSEVTVKKGVHFESYSSAGLLSASQTYRTDVWTCNACKYQLTHTLTQRGIFEGYTYDSLRFSGRCSSGNECSEKYADPYKAKWSRGENQAETTYCSSADCAPCAERLKKLMELGSNKIFVSARSCSGGAPQNSVVFADPACTIAEFRSNFAKCYCAGPHAPWKGSKVIEPDNPERKLKFYFTDIGEITDETKSLRELGVESNGVLEIGYF